MLLTPWIPPRPTTSTSWRPFFPILAVNILPHTPNPLTLPTEHRFLSPVFLLPHLRFVIRFPRVVAADTCVELAAAGVFYSDDVERRMPVCALS